MIGPLEPKSEILEDLSRDNFGASPLLKTPATAAPSRVNARRLTTDPLLSSKSSNVSLPPFANKELPPLKEYQHYVKLLTSFAENITITDWLVHNLNRIPHGLGDTAPDQLLVNALANKLRASNVEIAKEAAEAFISLSYHECPSWDETLASFAEAYPSGISSLLRNIFERINQFDPTKQRPLTHFMPVFKSVKMEMNKPISDTTNGDIYLSAIRKKLPSAQALLFVTTEPNMTWTQVFQKFQEIYNAQAVDDTFSLTHPGFGDTNVSIKKNKPFSVAVNTRSGGNASRGRFAPLPPRTTLGRQTGIEADPHPAPL